MSRKHGTYLGGSTVWGQGDLARQSSKRAGNRKPAGPIVDPDVYWPLTAKNKAIQEAQRAAKAERKAKHEALMKAQAAAAAERRAAARAARIKRNEAKLQAAKDAWERRYR